jgi:hypothetical protein
MKRFSGVENERCELRNLFKKDPSIRSRINATDEIHFLFLKQLISVYKNSVIIYD